MGPRNVGNKQNIKMEKGAVSKQFCSSERPQKDIESKDLLFQERDGSAELPKKICWPKFGDKKKHGRDRESQALRCLSYFSDLKIRAEIGIPKRHPKICKQKDKKQDPNPSISDLTSLKS